MKILIIGASSGLGRNLAERYASEGHQIGIVARREPLLQEIREKFPDNISVLAADISKETINQQLTEFIGRMGGMDLFLLTASVIHLQSELNAAEELETANINVLGFTRVIDMAWNYFVQSGGGQLAVVTSIAAARGNKSAIAYNASKAFQSHYLEGLRLKAKHEKNHIRITELVPGYIETAMGKGDRVFWMIPADQAAKLIMRAIHKEKARAFIPKRWWWVYQFQRILPTFIYERIVNGSWKLKSRS